MTTSILKIWI